MEDLSSLRRTMKIFEVMEVKDLRDKICEQIDLFSIVHLFVLCHGLYNILYTRDLRRWNIGKWDVDSRLRRFVDDPCLFWSNLDRSGGVMSGLNALQFLGGVYYPDSDLDIYFDDLEGLQEFGKYLVGEERYTLQDPDLVDSDLLFGVYSKPSQNEEEYDHLGERMVIVNYTQDHPWHVV